MKKTVVYSAVMVLALAAMASLALGLFAASRMNGRRSRS